MLFSTTLATASNVSWILLQGRPGEFVDPRALLIAYGVRKEKWLNERKSHKITVS
jgi:hypothetical protein